MADTPDNNNPFTRPPDWEREQIEARQTLAEQQEEIEQQKKEEAEKKQAAAAAQAETLVSQQSDEQRSQRFGQVISRERARAARARNNGGKPGATTAPGMEALDKEIAKLETKASSAWKWPYLLLLVGAAIIDLLQIFANVTLMLAAVAVVIGLVFSVARFIVLHYEAKRIDDNQMRKDMIGRTLISGAITIFPWVDLLPEQTVAMVIEWQMRSKLADRAESELKTKRAERDALLAQAQQIEAQEDFQNAA
jgi:hypothetical protein